MARRSGIVGVSRLRKTLRRIDPEATKQLRQAVDDGARAIKMDAIKLAPVEEGDLVRSIDYKLGRDGLTAVIGPGALAAQIRKNKLGSAWAATGLKMSERNKDRLFQFFKGYWIEYGTKGNAKKNIPAQPARPFMGPAFDMNKAWTMRRVQAAIRQALEHATRG